GRHPRLPPRHRAEGERAEVGGLQGAGGDRRRAAGGRPRRAVGAALAPRRTRRHGGSHVSRRQRRSYNVPMKAPVDAVGSLKYLLLRPFLRQAWARHRDTGLAYRVNLRDVVGRTILRRRAYEPGLTAWLLRELGDGGAEQGAFLDIGANIGWFSLQVAHSGRAGRVVALEPDAGNHALLQENIRRNGLGERIDAIACAAGAGA